MARWYPAHNYTPADPYSLQAVPNPGDYTDLSTEDVALVQYDGRIDFLVYDETNTDTESIPEVVVPDGNVSGSGRWIRKSYSSNVVDSLAFSSNGAIPYTAKLVEIDAGSGPLALTISQPVKGATVVITCTDGTNASTVTLTSGNFYFVESGINDSGNVATFDTTGQTLVLFGVSATRYVVLQNIGNVGIE